MTGFAENTGVAEAVGTAILILYVISQIGFSGANLYYDSFLPDVTTEERMDRVSTMGYGLGYIGGSTIPLLIFLVMNAVGVDMLYCLSFIFGFTAVWWAAFSWPLLKNVEQKSYQPHEKGAIRKTLRGLWATLKDIFGHKSIFVFMLAYFFYIDGVGTIIHMSTSYGAQLGLGDTEMMLALLLVQILGLPFCLMYIKLAGKFGARVMVGVGICIYMGICVFGFFVRETWQFWVLAILVATSRAASRHCPAVCSEKCFRTRTVRASTSAFFRYLRQVFVRHGPGADGLRDADRHRGAAGQAEPYAGDGPRGRVGRRAAGGIAVGRIVSSAHLPGGRGALLRRAAPHAEKKRARRSKKSVLPMCGRGGAPPEDPNAKGFDRYARSIYTYPHRPRGAGTKRGACAQYGGL